MLARLKVFNSKSLTTIPILVTLSNEKNILALENNSEFNIIKNY